MEKPFFFFTFVCKVSNSLGRGCLPQGVESGLSASVSASRLGSELWDERPASGVHCSISPVTKGLGGKPFFIIIISFYQLACVLLVGKCLEADESQAIKEL